MRISAWITALAVGLLLTAQVLTAQSRDRAEVALRTAMEKETVDGNLKAAIEDYKKLAQNANKSVAARALVRLGECYEKQGNAEASRAYEQVLNKFGDQKEAVAQARARLAALGGRKQAERLSTRLIWSSPNSGAESISPDGRYVSYTDYDKTGNLMLHDLVTGADRALTTEGSMKSGEHARPARSAISRDGKQIAYVWIDDKLKRSELRVANLNGDPNPRRLMENAVSQLVDWSPDGKSIAVGVQQQGGDPSSWQIALVNVQDGSLRRLKSLPQAPAAGAFSPDGKYLAYTETDAHGTINAYIVSLDGTSQVPLVSKPFPPARRFPSPSPVWTPDGARIILGTPIDVKVGGFSVVRVADGKPTGPPEPITGEFNNVYPIRFAQDGWLLYGAYTDRNDIYVAGLDPASGKLTSEPKRVNDRTPGQSWGRLSWLPDSKSMSYWSRRTGRDALVVHTLATGGERELWTVDIGAGPGYRGWFPDGSLMKVEGNGQNRILSRVDIQTMQVRASWTVPTLDKGPGPNNPLVAYSRDMMTEFFPRKDQAAPCVETACTHVLSALDFETGQQREICRLQAYSIGGLSVSPDGRDLAFVAWTSTGTTLTVAPIAGGVPRELHRGPDLWGGSTTWTQDGSHVLLLSAQSGGAVWSFPAKGGTPEKSPVHVPIEWPGNFVVSPDGTQIAFAASDSTTGIWAMRGLLPEGKPAAGR